jgi:Tfp pilus assembly protein PilN
MRPVNLLPAKHRPHKPSGGKSGSSYLVLGVLAIFLAAVVSYVLEANKITTAKSDISVAEQKTADARAKSQQMGPFANFAQIKQQRVASVRQLADGRFDWERTVRELAHVLPTGVWLRDFDASVTPGGDGATTSTDGTAWAGPSIRLHGCAQKQPQVAVMLVRLREMQGVHDVKLTDSTRGEDPDKTAGTASSDSASNAGADDCGVHNLRSNYEFNAVVEFDQTKPAPAPNAGQTPVRLGGGS